MKKNRIALAYLVYTAIIYVINVSILSTTILTLFRPVYPLEVLLYGSPNTFEIISLMIAVSIVLFELRLRKCTKANMWWIFLNLFGVCLIGPAQAIAYAFYDGRGYDTGNTIPIFLLLLAAKAIYCFWAIFLIFDRLRLLNEK